jgi:hypothetical protein
MEIWPFLASQKTSDVLQADYFIGKAPIVRSGRHIPAQTACFLNPLVSARMVGTSSGSCRNGNKLRFHH